MTYSISVIGQIIGNLDSRSAAFEERMEILNRIQSEYQIPLDLFLQLRQQLHHASDKDFTDLNRFIEDLPKNLKGKTAWYIHEETWKKFQLFKNYLRKGNHCFLAWFAQHLKPCLMLEHTELYHENEKVSEIYFITKGICFFELSASLNSFQYIKINEGHYFGEIDIYDSIMRLASKKQD